MNLLTDTWVPCLTVPEATDTDQGPEALAQTREATIVYAVATGMVERLVLALTRLGSVVSYLQPGIEGLQAHQYEKGTLLQAAVKAAAEEHDRLLALLKEHPELFDLWNRQMGQTVAASPNNVR